MQLGSYDACVVGAGPAGAIAARVLARAGARVALVAAARTALPVPIGETIPPAARSVLVRLGIDGCLSAAGHLPSAGNISRWGSKEEAGRESILDCHGPGWHVDRKRFDAYLISESECAGATLVRATFDSASWSTARSWKLQIRRQDRLEEICARYVVDCTGRSAQLAIAAGAQRRVYDKLVAVWALLELLPTARGRAFDDEDRRTYVEAAPEGWWYSARVPGRRRVLAYFTDGDLLHSRIGQSVGGFMAYLAEFPYLRNLAPWSDYRAVAEPVRVPAMSTRLNRAHGAGWVAAGDAAHCFDPLSSQGILASIIGGNNAAAALIASHASDPEALGAYQAQLNVGYAHYLAERHRYYWDEQRWNQNRFWRRRHHAYLS